MPSTVAMSRIAAKGNQEVLDRLDRTDALFTGAMTADQACAAFSTMIQWQGLARRMAHRQLRTRPRQPDPGGRLRMPWTALFDGAVGQARGGQE